MQSLMKDGPKVAVHFRVSKLILVDVLNLNLNYGIIVDTIIAWWKMLIFS